MCIHLSLSLYIYIYIYTYLYTHPSIQRILIFVCLPLVVRVDCHGLPVDGDDGVAQPHPREVLEALVDGGHREALEAEPGVPRLVADDAD